MVAGDATTGLSEPRERRFSLLLSLLSGAMLGLSFPPSPFYSVMYVALVPMLMLIDRTERTGRLLLRSYPGLLLFHVIALYWVGGFTHGRDIFLMIGGFALTFGHPIFYWIPLTIVKFVRNRFGAVASWAAFPIAWVGFDCFHAMGEFSFPWLTLANSQAYDLERIQLAEITGVSGISLILLVFNVLAFFLVREFSTRGVRRLRMVGTLVGALLVLYLVPWVYGTMLLDRNAADAEGRAVRVGVLQPNIDPWEKWGEGFASKWDSYNRQFDLLMAESDSLRMTSLDLVVWPETAVPFYLLHPSSGAYRARLQQAVDRSGVPLFTGLPAAVYFNFSSAPVTARPAQVSGLLVEYYNAATLFLPYRDPGPVYKKIVLVPFAERIPYAEIFSFLVEPLKWGVGISGWGKGADTVVYTLPVRGEETHFSAMICYESVYPEFVRRFVQKGAGFLLIITNDSWYGATSGPYQHAAIASLRAVENRRWIVRCANGGISGLIDPFGRMHQRTELFTQERFVGAIRASSRETFYTRHGDLAGRGSLILAVALCLGAGVQTVFRKKREHKAHDENRSSK